MSKDGHDLVVQDYFKGATRAALASPDGAQLSGSIVDALTGHVEYAQADGSITAAKVIGHVTKLAGSATAIRNGVSIQLNVGDNVNKGDVVQAGGGSSLGLTFIDGTVFGLSSNARMVLNEMIYDPNGSSNSSLLSLVQGTITFVAGETAKHGDMRVDTPTATMGIRGTAVLVEIDFEVPGQGNAPPVKFQVLVEPNGVTGSYVLYSKTDPNLVLGTVNQAHQVTSVNGPGDVSQSQAGPLSPDIIKIIEQTFALSPYFPNYVPNPNPQGTGPHGSAPANPVPTNPSPDPLKLELPPDQPVGEPKTIPIKLNLLGDTPGAPTTTIPVTITVLKTIDVSPVVDHDKFAIADHVTVEHATPSDVVVPYVPGTGKVLSVDGPANIPSDLANFITIDPQTGVVSYDHSKFAFLGQNQKVVVTIGFDTSIGSDTFHESLTLTIDGVHAAPVITAAALTLAQDGTVVLNTSNFVVADPDSSSFTFTVSNVTHGMFQTTADGVHWYNATTFTTADLNAGHVRFMHDGGEAAPTFSIQADDGTAQDHLSSTIAGTVNFSFVNDAPTVTDATLFVPEGGIVVLDHSSLTITHPSTLVDFSVYDRASGSGAVLTTVVGTTFGQQPHMSIGISDPDSSSFTLTVSNVTHGTFQTTTDGVHWVDATTFTTDDINASHVRFVHDGSDAAPTFSIQADDGATANHASNVFIGSVGFTDVNNAPVIQPPVVADPGPVHAPAGTPDGEGGFTPVVLSNNFTFSDQDFFDSHQISATFDAQASNLGPLEGPIGTFADTLLNDSTGGNQGVVNWSLTLSSADLVNINNASFLPPGSTVHEVYDVTVSDGHGGTAVRQVSIEIDGPLGVAGPHEVTIAADRQGHALPSDLITIIDASASVTATVVDQTPGSGIDITSTSPYANLFVSNDNGGGTFTGTVAQANDFFDHLVATSSTDSAASKTLLLTVSDGISPPVIDHLTITATATSHVAPVVDAGNSSVSYQLGGAGVAVDSGLTVSDVDSANLRSASIAITNFQSGDTLIFANTTSITGSFDSETGILTLTGSDSVANYQAALDSISYQNINAEASTADRTISFQVDDGAASNHLSNIGTATVSVTASVPPPPPGTWIGPTSDNEWSTGSNWSNGTPPGNGKEAFVVGGNPQVDSDVTIDGVMVSLQGGGEIDVGVTSAAILTLDDDTAINGGTLTIGSSSDSGQNNGTLEIETGTLGSGHGATLDGVSVSITRGSINIGKTTSGTILALDDDTLIAGGSLTIGSGSTLEIAFGPTGPGATLDGVSVANSGNVQVDVAQTHTSKLTLDDDTSITGGTLTIGSSGELDIATGKKGSGHGATLDGVDVDNCGAIVVDVTASGAILTLDHATMVTGGTLSIGPFGTLDIAQGGAVLDGVTVTSSGKVQIDTCGALVLDHGTAINGGTITNDGTIDATGVGVLNTGNAIVNNGLLEATRGGTLDVADSIHNTGAGGNGIVVDAASTLLVDRVGNDFTFTLQLDGHGAVSLEGGQITENPANQFVVSSGSVLALDNIDNTISGYGAIGSGDGHLRLKNEAGATIDASGGTLTLDTGNAITNNGLLEATTGGTLVVDDAVTGTGSEIIGDSGILKFMSSVDSTTQTVTFTGAGTLYLGGTFGGKIAGISGSDILDLAGFDAATTTFAASFDSGTGTTTLTVTDTPVHSMNLTLVGDYSAANFAKVSDGTGGTAVIVNREAPTVIAGAVGAQRITATTSHVYQFQGAIISSQEASGLSISSSDNNSSDLIVAELDRASSITASEGADGIGFASLAADIAIFNAAAIAADNVGILASGSGNVAVNDASNTTVSGGQVGIEAREADSSVANVDVNVGAGATIDSTSSYGILAINRGAGNISVRTSSGDHINSGGAGIDAVNEATSAPASDHSAIVVNAFGTIHSGTGVTGTGKPPAGILAGYFGGGETNPTTYPITTLHGDVLVNSSADITAEAGDGIRAFNYGIGNVTVNDNAGTIIALGGESPTDGFGSGISANNFGPGNIEVFTAAGTVIHSGSSGISANNHASASPSSSEVSILAYGTIISGNIPSGDGNPNAGILAGYTTNNRAADDVHGNVIIDDHASIAAATDGIRGYNYGTGTVTVIAEAGAVIIAERYGLAARGHNGGDVSVINYASVTATTALDANTTTGNIHIDNHGIITGDIVVGNPSPEDAPFTGHATVDNEAGAIWNLVGNSTFAGTTQLINDGTIDATALSSITTTGVLNFSNAGTVNGSLSFMIGSGAQLEFGASVSASDTITFLGSTGTLKIDNAASFHSTIAGLRDDGANTYAGADHIDLADVAFGSLTTPTFDAAHDILTVSDGTHTAVLQLTGSYSLGNFHFQNDGNGGTMIWDPPLSGGSNANPGTAQATANTIVASGPNATLTGDGASDHFVFDFANIGRATVTNFHADADLLQLRASVFANAQAVLDATQDDGHGNAVIAMDAHDSITLAGVAKAQLHQTDFHLV